MSLFRNFGERGWSGFLAVVEAEREIRPACPLQLSV